METKNKIEPLVISPTKDHHKRGGKGFSLSEIKEAGKTIELLNELNLNIDYMRRSSHTENIELLKNLKPPSKKGKPREPFVFKEKKRTSFKIKEEKPKVAPLKEIEVPVGSKARKEKAPIKKEKIKSIKKEKLEKKEGGLSLTSLSGLGSATASKFEELGVATVEELIKEDPSELSTLIKGVSEERIKKWIDEGKELLK